MNLSNKHLKDLLPSALHEIEKNKSKRPDLVVAGWSEIIEPKWRSMTQAISFEKGQLVVKVKNTALYSLLVQQEKPRLLADLQKKFPAAGLKNIVFRIG
jgi:hypothetical protein